MSDKTMRFSAAMSTQPTTAESMLADLTRRLAVLETYVGMMMDRQAAEEADVQDAVEPSDARVNGGVATLAYVVPGLGHLIVTVEQPGEEFRVTWRAPNKQRVTLPFRADDVRMSGNLYDLATAEPGPYRRRRH